MNEQIWKYIAELSTPGFFVTADIMYGGDNKAAEYAQKASRKENGF